MACCACGAELASHRATERTIHQMKRIYHGFGGKLHHGVPAWVRDDAIFHVCIRGAAENPIPLTDPALGAELLESVRFYHEREVWFPRLFLLMPDHVHALLAIHPRRAMSRVIGDWKKWQHVRHGVLWQEGYFDHRLRDHDRQLAEKTAYILNNPVVAGLCARAEDWRWRYEPERSQVNPERGQVDPGRS
jgi:hypothetical protein